MVARHGVWLESVAVDDDGLWSDGQLVECAVHGQDGCVQDVYLVNLLWAHDAYSPTDRIALNLLTQLIATALSELF